MAYGQNAWYGCPFYGSPKYPAHDEDGECYRIWSKLPPDDQEFNNRVFNNFNNNTVITYIPSRTDPYNRRQKWVVR